MASDETAAIFYHPRPPALAHVVLDPLPMFRQFIRIHAGSGPAEAALARRDTEALACRWHDEATDAALSGNPRRAHYLEVMAERLMRGEL